jgi:hypothetical protein
MFSPCSFTNTLDTPLVTPKRNRHSVENDQQTALIKRINRKYANLQCDRKVRIVEGHPALFILSTGERRPFFPADTLQDLLEKLNAVR